MFKTRELRSGRVTRVVFYYPGEEATYLENAHVVLYKNGILDVFHHDEQVTTHIQNVEIIWKTRRETSKPFRLIKSEITQTH